MPDTRNSRASGTKPALTPVYHYQSVVIGSGSVGSVSAQDSTPKTRAKRKRGKTRT